MLEAIRKIIKSVDRGIISPKEAEEAMILLFVDLGYISVHVPLEGR